jgi:hypothetical protein
VAERLELVVPWVTEEQAQLLLQRPAEGRMPRAVRFPQVTDAVPVVGRQPETSDCGRAARGGQREHGPQPGLGVMMSPLAAVVAENSPRVGV